MFPITLDLTRINIMLVGEGDAATRRLAQLKEAGATHIAHYTPGDLPTPSDFDNVSLVMIVDMEEWQSEQLAEIAREKRILVNVEDNKDWCDFHFPSIVRRGSLLLTISTAGKSPALAKAIRKRLEGLFGPEWGGRVDELERKRLAWKAEGKDFNTVKRLLNDAIAVSGWFKTL
jgi:precorrin-2 dehydrogenase / sirohydrochlorin ferrochelatase